MKKLHNFKWLLSGMLICILIPSLVFNAAMANTDGNVIRYGYDENGLLILREERDLYGWLIRETRFNVDGSINYWLENIYDENRLLIRINFHNADGSIKRWIEIEKYGYDGEGNIIEKNTSYNADGSVDERWFVTFINVVEHTSYNPDGSVDQRWYSASINPNLNPNTGRFNVNWHQHRTLT